MYMRTIHTGLQLNIRQVHISALTTEQVNEQKTVKHGTNKRRWISGSTSTHIQGSGHSTPQIL